jgi:hypothetical protein
MEEVDVTALSDEDLDDIAGGAVNVVLACVM